MFDREKERRRFIMRRRRQVKPRRRLVATERVGLAVRYRCLTCGATSLGKPFRSEREAEFYLRWHGEQSGGCGGDCPRCTKEARDRLYPLPPIGGTPKV